MISAFWSALCSMLVLQLCLLHCQAYVGDQTTVTTSPITSPDEVVLNKANTLLYVCSQNNGIYTVPLTGANAGTPQLLLAIPFTNNSCGSGLALSSDELTLYYTDFRAGTLAKILLPAPGSTAPAVSTVVASGLRYPLGLAITADQQTAYITDPGFDTSPFSPSTLWQVSLLTTAVTNLTGSINLPDAIALSADQQTLYITTGGGLLVSYTIATGGIANLTSRVFTGAFDDAFGPDPNLVYITDNEKNALFVYQRAQQNLVLINTTFAQSIFFPVEPTGIAISDDGTTAYIADYRTGNILAVTISNTPFIPVGVLGDPQFTGLRGQQYQVHGMDHAIYNLISDKELQVNAQFVFVAEGGCARSSQHPDFRTPCWSHAGSYIRSIGLQQRRKETGRVETILIVSGSGDKGFTDISLNGRNLTVGDRYSSNVKGGIEVAFNHAHSLTVVTPLFSFKFENSDGFINQQLSVLRPLHQLSCHGLLGQTYRTQKYSGSKLETIEGEVDDYVIDDQSLTGTRFLFNQF
jgi:DNA-binding beta-propeller fold protein YncE